MNIKWITSLLLGIVISIGGLYLAFRNVPLAELLNYLASIDYIWLLPSVALVILSFVFRVLRWRIILGSIRQIDFWPAFHPLMIAFMINTILPGRVGELVRPAILQKRTGVPYSSGLATVAAERAFDLIIIVILFFAVMSTVQIDPEFGMAFGGNQLNQETLEAITAGLAKLSLVLTACIALVSIDTCRRWIGKGIAHAPAYLLFFVGKERRGKLAAKVSLRLVALLEGVASGFSMVRSPLKITVTLLLSALIWILAALSYAVFALGCPGITVNLIEMTAVMVIVCIFIALPSVPGYWGLWEAGGIFALTLFGVAHNEAAGFTLANHALQVIPVMVIGAISAWITGINIWRTSIDKATKNAHKEDLG